MTEHVSPIWVRDRDGQVVPFEADRISQLLFAATEELGRPDAFLAREITDGVVHFLAEETDDSPPNADELPEMIAKVVRELGQPALALCFAERSRRPEPHTAHSQADIYPKNLVAAQRDGLLTIFGSEHSLEFAGSVLGPREAFASAREHTGGLVAIDAPEYGLAALAGDPATLAAEYVRELQAEVKATGLAAVVNVNIASPPSWERDLAVGPLFADVRQPFDPARVAQLADALRATIASRTDQLPPVEVAWHLTAADFAKDKKPRLLTVCANVAERPIAFMFDRPRRAVSLGSGLSRQHPAILVAVAVHLERLLDQSPAVAAEPFLRKLGTLARLARSAGHAKQDFLRKRALPAMTRGFLLDRGRLMVVPTGLDTVVQRLTGCRIIDSGNGEEFARRILTRLRESLAHEKPRTMDAGLEVLPLPASLSKVDAAKSNSYTVANHLLSGDGDSTPQEHLRGFDALHAAADGGSATVTTPDISADAIAALLKWTWNRTNICQLRLIAPA